MLRVNRQTQNGDEPMQKSNEYKIESSIDVWFNLGSENSVLVIDIVMFLHINKQFSDVNKVIF